MTRPCKPNSDRRSRKLVFWVNEREYARYLVNATQAAQTPTDFARARLCFEPEAQGPESDKATHNPQLTFEYVDALNRVGTGLARLLRLAEQTETGILPEVQALMRRLDALLDRELPS